MTLGLQKYMAMTDENMTNYFLSNFNTYLEHNLTKTIDSFQLFIKICPLKNYF